MEWRSAALRVLLDQEDRRAARGGSPRSSRRWLDQDRREPQGGLVEQQHARRPSARARWPASAARRRRACPPSASARSLRRGKSANTRSKSAATPRVAPRVGAQLEVLLHRQVGEDVRPSGTRTRPSRDDAGAWACARDVLAVDSGPRRRRPAPGPMIARSVVVLPAPLAPISVTISPSRQRERDALDRLDGAVGDRQVPDLEDRRMPDVGSPRRPRPGRPRSPSGSRWICAGVPLGDRRAVVEHVRRVSQIPMTTFMLCSIRRIVHAELVADPADQVASARASRAGSSRRPARRAGAARGAVAMRARDLEPPLAAVGEVARRARRRARRA